MRMLFLLWPTGHSAPSSVAGLQSPLFPWTFPPPQDSDCRRDTRVSRPPARMGLHGTVHAGQAGPAAAGAPRARASEATTRLAEPHPGRGDVIELVSHVEQREPGNWPGVEGAGRARPSRSRRAVGTGQGRGAGEGRAGAGGVASRHRAASGGGARAERAGPAPRSPGSRTLLTLGAE